MKRLTQHSAAYRPKQSSMIHGATSQPTHSTEGAGACIQWAKMSDTLHPSALAQEMDMLSEVSPSPKHFRPPMASAWQAFLRISILQACSAPGQQAWRPGLHRDPILCEVTQPTGSLAYALFMSHPSCSMFQQR